MSEKYEACFNIFQSECSIYWRFNSNIETNLRVSEQKRIYFTASENRFDESSDHKGDPRIVHYNLFRSNIFIMHKT